MLSLEWLYVTGMGVEINGFGMGYGHLKMHRRLKALYHL
jgi:hypothetical protein